MFHAVALSMSMQLVHGLVLGICSRVALVSGTHFMLGFPRRTAVPTVAGRRCERGR
jgi:hypothetical protein